MWCTTLRRCCVVHWQVTYNGDELKTGVVATNIAKLVTQDDRHMPLLTVRETLEYAERFQTVVRRLL